MESGVSYAAHPGSAQVTLASGTFGSVTAVSKQSKAAISTDIDCDLTYSVKATRATPGVVPTASANATLTLNRGLRHMIAGIAQIIEVAEAQTIWNFLQSSGNAAVLNIELGYSNSQPL